jgi:hypothetical protein
MHKDPASPFTLIPAVIAASLGFWAALAPAAESDDTCIPRIINSSTIPSNGDLNPYGVFVPEGPSEIVEFTKSGQFVREYNVDSSQGGAFGLDTVREGPFNYAVIDDVTNNLSVYRLQER